MLDQLPRRRSDAERRLGDPELRWSWYLFLLSYPWHLVGGAIAFGVTSLAGGDFSAGEGVPNYVYPALCIWMTTPLVASILVGVRCWLKGHRLAAIWPVLASAAMIVIVMIFGYSEFSG